MILTLVGSMAAHCLARYRFRLNRMIYFVLFSTIIFPPQITIISLFQILVQYGLYNSKLGLTLVYVAIQLPLTIYILESFFARIPSDLFDAARMDGYSDWEIFWRVSAADRAAGRRHDGDPELHPALERVPLRGRAHHRRCQPHAAARHPALHRRHQQEDVGMIATGLMIAIIPVVVVYAFFSERLIQGMTAGAVK